MRWRFAITQEPWSLSHEASVKTHELRPFSPVSNRRVRPLILATAIEALSPPGSSLQASHQDALIHLRASAAPLRTQKTIPQPLYQRDRVDPWAGRTAWVTALRRSPSCSVLRTAKCTGVAFAQPGRISCSHRLRYRNIGSCGSYFARLMGKFTHRGTGHNASTNPA
jgi:hypothetical protein